MFYTKTYNHDAFGTKTHKLQKSIRKSISQEAICTKTQFQAANLFESIYIKSQLYENMQRVTGLLENTNILYENVQTTFKKTKNISEEAGCTKT